MRQGIDSGDYPHVGEEKKARFGLISVPTSLNAQNFWNYDGV
jgi:hypothetical protein